MQNTIYVFCLNLTARSGLPLKKSVALESGAYIPKKKSLFQEFKKNYAFLIMLLPGVIALLLFSYKPMYGLLIAFKDYKLKLGVFFSPWADQHGLEHFIRMFSGRDFTRILRNTIFISFLKILFSFPTPIILALLLNEMRGKIYKRVVQTLSYLPHFFSWVILGGIFKMLFSSLGPINTILTNLGLSEPVPFFSNNFAFICLLIGTAVWANMGWSAVIYIAALSGVDESLYEAAYIDGASRWKQVWHISIPCIMGTVVTTFIISLGSILDAGFDQVYNMYNPMVYEMTDILDTYSMRLLQDGRYELGTALGLFKSLVGLCFVLSSNWIISKISKDEYGIL